MGCALVILSHPDGEWAGLFKDGLLVDQGHDIRFSQLAVHCPIDSLTEETLAERAAEWLSTYGQFDAGETLDGAKALVFDDTEDDAP